MPITRLEVSNYRSLRAIRVPFAGVTVLLGANGSGKTSAYRALRLLQAAALGRLAEAFVEEGGMPSALWAGKRGKPDAVRLRVAVTFDRYEYRLACGLPTPKGYGVPPHVNPSRFSLDPEVKEEDLLVRVDGAARPVPMVERRVNAVTVRDADGRRATHGDPLDLGESVLSQLVDPSRYGELALARGFFADWRFYHQFRADARSPLREPRLGVRSPVLSSDGLNLASALQTIVEIGHEDELQAAIDAALPGSSVEIVDLGGCRLDVQLRQAGVHRPLASRELSDGTLRFLCLTAALLTPRPPAFLVLNEPESSLHGALIAPLAGMIAAAAGRSQVLLTTHDESLARRLEDDAGALVHRLVKEDGETTIVGDEHSRWMAR